MCYAVRATTAARMDVRKRYSQPATRTNTERGSAPRLIEPPGCREDMPDYSSGVIGWQPVSSPARSRSSRPPPFLGAPLPLVCQPRAPDRLGVETVEISHMAAGDTGGHPAGILVAFPLNKSATAARAAGHGATSPAQRSQAACSALPGCEWTQLQCLMHFSQLGHNFKRR
jgi:hypothetical protein